MLLSSLFILFNTGTVSAQDLAGCPSNAAKTGTGFDVKFYGNPILNENGWDVDWFDHVPRDLR